MIHNRKVGIRAVKLWNHVPLQSFVLSRNLRKRSTTRPLYEGRNRIETIAKSQFNFDHKLWWESHGNGVRNLLESGTNRSDVGIINDHAKLSKAQFERTYASDAIYQDLFIDSPPCRKTLELSFALINRFWSIQIIKWNPPILMSTLEDYKSVLESDSSNEVSKSLSGSLFLRVPYTAKQRPRLFLIPTSFWNKFPDLKEIVSFQYEGWIDLHIRPTAVSIDSSPDGSSSWKVYRHDDRVRVDPPNFLVPRLQQVNSKAGGTIDALTVVQSIPLISTMFQWFRRAHGEVVCYFAQKRI